MEIANPILIKLAITAATDKRTWKVVAVIIAAVLSPLILLIMIILVVFSGGMEYNKETAEYYFSAEMPPDTMPIQQKEIIEKTKENLIKLDNLMSEKQTELDGDSFDTNKIKAVFLAVQEQIVWDDSAYEAFMYCFVRDYETTVDGEKIIEKQYIRSLTSVTENIKSAFPEADLSRQHTQFINSMYEYLTEEKANE